MLKALEIDADIDQVDVGYFNIPDNPTLCEVHLLDLDSKLRESALHRAAEVAAEILDGNFQPQLDASQIPYDDYSMILQTGIAENLLADADITDEGDA